MKSIVRFAEEADSLLQGAFKNHPKWLGRLYAFFSSVMGFINPFMIQMAGEKNTHRIMLVRGLFMCLMSYWVIQCQEKPRTWVHHNVMYKLIFRGMLNITMFYIFFWGLNYMNLQIALTIFQTSTMMTYILAVITGEEALTKARVISSFGVMVGLCLIINPHLIYLNFSLESDTKEVPGYHLAVVMILFTAFLKAIVNLLLKTMRENDPMINNMYSSSTSLIIVGYGFIFSETTFQASLRTWVMFLLSGLTTFAMMTYNFKAIRYEDTSIVAIICSLSVFYSYIVNVVVLKESPEVGGVLGSIIVVFFMGVLTLSDPKKK